MKFLTVLKYKLVALKDKIKDKVLAWWKKDSKITVWWKSISPQRKMIFWGLFGALFGLLGGVNGSYWLMTHAHTGSIYWTNVVLVPLNFILMLINLFFVAYTVREKIIYKKWFKLIVVFGAYFIGVPFWCIPKNVIRWLWYSIKGAYEYLRVEYTSCYYVFKFIINVKVPEKQNEI